MINSLLRVTLHRHDNDDDDDDDDGRQIMIL